MYFCKNKLSKLSSMKITTDDLLVPYDFSVLENDKGKFLVIIYENKKNAEALHILLENVEYEIYVEYDKTIFFTFALNLPECPVDTLIYDTKQSIESYPPISSILNKEIKYITAGYFGEDGIMYNQQLLPLQSFYVSVK